MENFQTLVAGRSGHSPLIPLFSPGIVEREISGIGQLQTRCRYRHCGTRQRREVANRQRTACALRVNRSHVQFALGALVHGVGVGVDGHHHGGARQAVVPAALQQFSSARPHVGRQLFESQRKMLGNQIHQHAVVNDRVVVVVPAVTAGFLLGAVQQVGPRGLNQLIGQCVLFEQLIAGCQVGCAQIVAPARFGLGRLGTHRAGVVTQRFAQICQRARNQNALAGQQIHGLGFGAPQIGRVVIAAQPGLQITVGFLDQIGRHSQLAIVGL